MRVEALMGTGRVPATASFVAAFIVVAVFVGACSSQGGSGTNCGPGTMLVAGECVVAESGALDATQEGGGVESGTASDAVALDAADGGGSAQDAMMLDATFEDGNSDGGADAFSCPVPAPTDGGACNAGLAVSGPPIMTTCPSQSLPAATGGTILDGIYVLISSQAFGVCTALTTRATQAWCGNQNLAVLEENNTTFIFGSSFTVAGSMITETEECGPHMTQNTIQFTASPTQLVLYYPVTAGTTLVNTYARQ
jgi:hypothetical protein